MAKRNLCYKHHCQEFDKLPDAMRHLAADWRTVEPCEICAAERDDLLATMEILEMLYDAIDDYIYSPGDNAYPDDYCNPEFLEALRLAFLDATDALETAKQALAAAEAK